MTCPPYSRNALVRWTVARLRELGLRPHKRLGQNFMVNPRIAYLYRRILPENTDYLEVGPGLGTLTCALSSMATRILAIELDPVLASASSETLGSIDNVVVVNGDALDFIPLTNIKVIASNLPYNISTQILAESVKNNNISFIAVIIQEEVARRLLARPGSQEYGRISAVLQYYFSISIAGVFPPSSFYPRPEVRSALTLLRRKRPWSPGDEAFLALARCLFSFRNKLLRKAAKKCLPNTPIPRKLEDVRIRNLDPETLYYLSMTFMGRQR